MFIVLLFLDCFDCLVSLENLLKNLPNIPNNIFKLDLSYNKFKTFDISTLPETLDYFDITNNINILNNSKIKSFCNLWTHGFNSSRSKLISKNIIINEKVNIDKMEELKMDLNDFETLEVLEQSNNDNTNDDNTNESNIDKLDSTNESTVDKLNERC